MQQIWDNIEILESSNICVSKFIFTKNDAIAEAVLYKYPTYKDRTVICCSIQSGCPIGCTFCGTGKKFIRNLTVNEIIEQITTCLQHTKENAKEIQKLQIMFMSMGEPMLNWKVLKEVLTQLNSIYPSAELLISTSAPRTYKNFEDLCELSKKIPKIGVQFSMHESTDTERDILIPFKEKLTLKEIANTGTKWFKATNRKPYFNYCVHQGNNSYKNVLELLELFTPKIWECTLSVICESNESIKRSTDRQLDLINEFSGLMVLHGFNVRVFNPAGQDDIGGGCGQLWHVQNWFKGVK